MPKLVLTIESLLLLLVWMWIWEKCVWSMYNRWRDSREQTKREWNVKPRTPEDCPTCRLEKQWQVQANRQTART